MLAREMVPGTFENFLDRFEPFFGRELLPRVTWPRKLDVTAEWRPHVDIIESKDEYLVKCELPEARKEDIRLDLADGMLRIRGERKFSVDETKDKVHRLEAYYGTFLRSFAMPENVEVRKIRAEVADGVLKVHLPKMATVAPKPVEITVQ